MEYGLDWESNVRSPLLSNCISPTGASRVLLKLSIIWRGFISWQFSAATAALSTTVGSATVGWAVLIFGDDLKGFWIGEYLLSAASSNLIVRIADWWWMNIPPAFSHKAPAARLSSIRISPICLQYVCLSRDSQVMRVISLPSSLLHHFLFWSSAQPPRGTPDNMTGLCSLIPSQSSLPPAFRRE